MTQTELAILRKENEIAELFKVTPRAETIFNRKLARLRRELNELKQYGN